MRRSATIAGAILILATIFNLALPNKVYACLCGPNDRPVEVAGEEADAIFTGEVIAINEDRDYILGFEDVTFAVMTTWKGVAESQVTVRDYSTDCSFEFKKGASYLVYAIGDEVSPLSTGKCMRTRLLSVADADISVLGQGQIINQMGRSQNLDQASPSTNLILPALAFLILFVFAVLVAVKFLRKRRSAII